MGSAIISQPSSAIHFSPAATTILPLKCIGEATSRCLFVQGDKRQDVSIFSMKGEAGVAWLVSSSIHQQQAALAHTNWLLDSLQCGFGGTSELCSWLWRGSRKQMQSAY